MDDSNRDDPIAALAAAASGADAGLAVAVDGEVVAVTDQWCECRDEDRDAVVGSSVKTVVEGDPPTPGETVRVARDANEAGDDGGETPADPAEYDALPDPTLELTAETAEVRGTEYRVYTCRDVTDQVARERDSQVLDAMFAHLPFYIYLKDDAARHVRVSDFNETAQGHLGKTDPEIFGGPDAAEAYADDMRVIEAGEHVVRKQERDEDSNEYFLTTKVPWRDDDGEIRGLVGVTHDVTERMRHRQQLERQNDRLRTVASVISHDVRNPLQVADGRLEMARETCDSDHLDTAAAALDRIATLLEELLAMVRHGQWVEETEPVAMRPTAREVWATAAADSATLAVDEEFTLSADRARLQQLLENLFRNAVVHAGPDVTVRIGPLDDWTGFYVADDGPGIPHAEREDVFELGYTTAEEGTGFGLTVVEVIADAHGWDVRLAEAGEEVSTSDTGGNGRSGDENPPTENSATESDGDDTSGARFEFVGVEFV